MEILILKRRRSESESNHDLGPNPKHIKAILAIIIVARYKTIYSVKNRVLIL